MCVCVCVSIIITGECVGVGAMALAWENQRASFTNADETKAIREELRVLVNEWVSLEN